MLALFGSEFVLILAAALIGFALGWRVRAASHAIVQRNMERDVEDLRRRLGEAAVRRAGGT
ncbi:MAG: hypothetical protein JNJ73_05975 [Hyphomonadaceae bacterium]|nr:hypothetical protein [Hyphomonadaceae bacterium]